MTETTEGNAGNGAEQPRARSSTERSRAHRARKKLEREAALQKAEAEREATLKAEAERVAEPVASVENAVASAAPRPTEPEVEREAAALHEAERTEREAGGTETATIDRVADRVADVAYTVAPENAVSSPPVAVAVASFGNGVLAPLELPQWRTLPRVERLVGLAVVPAWLQRSFGGLCVFLSFVIYLISTLANMLVWAGPNPTENRKAMILAAGALVTEMINYAIPSAISFASSQLLRRSAWVIWFVAMAIAATGGAAFVRDNLGTAEVSRNHTANERDRLQRIIDTPMTPVVNDAVVDARNWVENAQKRVAIATANRKTDCPKNKSLDVEVCNRAKVALDQANVTLEKAEADLKQANANHDVDKKAAEQRYRDDIDKAKADLKALPSTSNDGNAVFAGVAAIMPFVSEAWVNGIVAGFWIVMFNLGSCVLLRLGLALLAPTQWEPA
jgi:hypothetical protein